MRFLFYEHKFNDMKSKPRRFAFFPTVVLGSDMYIEKKFLIWLEFYELDNGKKWLINKK